MHLHRLSLQAIGPFPGTHTIDVAELGASGLFLLEGPTGSGKSTLIDAIVFALYGKVASAGASEDRLRSAHAAPEVESWVELVLETGSGIYRVRRSPAYQRPKQRGTGTTLQQAGVRLWRLTSPDDAVGELLSSRIDEAGLELQRVVGLDRTQFVQTVVLPQGEFAGFLRAEPEARRGLLQKVFGTEVYERLQQRLERMRAQAARDVAAARRDADLALARFVGAVAPEPGHVLHEADAAGSLPVAEAVVVELSGLATEAEAIAREAGAARDAAASEVTTRRAAVEAIRRRTRLRAEQSALAARAEHDAVERDRWEAGVVADRLWPAVSAAQRGRAAVADALDVVGGCVTAASADLRDLVGAGDPEVQLKALRVEHEATATSRAVLARAVELEAGLADRRDALAARRGAVERSRAAMARGEELLAAVPAERAALVADLEAARADALRGGAAQAALAGVRARLVAAREAEALAAEVLAGEALVTRCSEVALGAARSVLAAREARIAGLAGELAAALVPGEPCAVCGSPDHPRPAPAPEAAGADVEGAEEQQAAADGDLAEALTALGVLRARLADRSATAAGTVEELTSLATQAAAALEATTAATARAADLAGALDELDARVGATQAQLAPERARLAQEDGRLAAETEQLAADETEVLSATDGEASVATRVQRLDRYLAQVDAWRDALSVLVGAQDQAEHAERDLAAALGADGVTEERVLAARLAAADLAALRRTLDAYAADVARVAAALADPDLAALPEVAEDDVNVAAAEAVLAEAEAVVRAAAGRATAGAERAAAARRELDALRACVERLSAAVAEAAPVTRMADLAAASSSENGLSLATYVLARRFEDLVEAANARLSAMSDGRYALERSDEREDVRSRRTGLAMRVLDHATGVARDPRTLSGGETFYVSLCLALGLADVVTAEAGGVDLGTLLIDEGFGSLDGETLEVVLAELGRLRDGGRVVGVVSHVEAMKSAIAERVEVRRRADGTSTLTVRA
jgi:exonuclease SbcC